MAEEPVSLSVAGVRGLGEAAVLLSLADTSEETRLRRQVAQATKMQAVGQLAGGVAHDFNNVLTAIIGYCDLMLLRHTPGDSDYDDIQQIRASSNRAASLTRQLLAFSRQQTLRPEVLQLPDVLSDVSHLLKRLIGEKIQLTVKHDRDLGPVRADPSQLEQVIVNLVVNKGFDGIDLDYEGFAFSDGRSSWTATRPNWAAFVAELGASPCSAPGTNADAVHASRLQGAVGNVGSPAWPAMPAPLLELWDAVTGQRIAEMQGEQDAMGLAFSPDGKLLMVLGKRPDPLDQLGEVRQSLHGCRGGGQTQAGPCTKAQVNSQQQRCTAQATTKRLNHLVTLPEKRMCCCNANQRQHDARE